MNYLGIQNDNLKSELNNYPDLKFNFKEYYSENELK